MYLMFFLVVLTVLLLGLNRTIMIVFFSHNSDILQLQLDLKFA